MEALIFSSQYDRLVALRQEMLDTEIGSPARVFVPVGGTRPGEPLQMPRVLYVGKATRGFGESELGGYSNAIAASAKVVDEWMLPGGSAFWQFIRSVLRRLADDCAQSGGDRLVEHFAWSNLAKIGDLDGNPDSRSLAMQSEMSRELLAAEIQAFQPTATVLATTNYAEKEIVFPLFGKEDWQFDTVDRDRVAFKEHPVFGLVIWTNHPQGMRPAGTRGIVQTFVADLVLRHWRGEPLPECVRAASVESGPTNID